MGEVLFQHDPLLSDKPGVFHTEWMESDAKPTEKPAQPKEQSRAAE